MKGCSRPRRSTPRAPPRRCGSASTRSSTTGRADPAVTRAKVKTATVTGHGRVPVIADGERVRMGRSVTVEYVPVAFRALAPAKSESTPPSRPFDRSRIWCVAACGWQADGSHRR